MNFYVLRIEDGNGLPPFAHWMVVQVVQGDGGEGYKVNYFDRHGRFLDHPTVEFRGDPRKAFGSPWTFETREAAVQFMRSNASS